MQGKRLVVVVILIACALRTRGQVTCKDEDGNDVEWFAILKAPNGAQYMYTDANSESLRASPNSLADPFHGALSFTLAQLWGGDSFMAYNDQPPPDGSGSSSYGHTKGILMVDDQAVAPNRSGSGGIRASSALAPGYVATAGFWLVHSTPRFPDTDGPTYLGLPEKEHIYGQSFLCITQGEQSLKEAAELLYYNHPNVFNSSISARVQAAIPRLAQVAAGEHSDSDVCKQAGLAGAKGTAFTAFGKGTAFNKDLWGECVAPALGSDMIVESWLRGYEEGAYCRPDYQQDTVDASYLEYHPTGEDRVQRMVVIPAEDSESGVASVTSANWEWKETQDHSKWGVAGNTPVARGSNGTGTGAGAGEDYGRDGAQAGNQLRGSGRSSVADSVAPWVCIGDINRMTSQFKRGGGCVCMQNQLLHQAMRGAITNTIEDC